MLSLMIATGFVRAYILMSIVKCFLIDGWRAPLSSRIVVVVNDWDASKAHAVPIRREVFVQEQGVPVELELDNEDASSLHAVAFNGSGLAVGTGRLLRNAHIGRMAVLSAYRGQGVGAALLRALLNKSLDLGYKEVVLSAQLHAQDFYAAHGFVAEDGIYLDAGIEHITMRRLV